MYYSDLISVTPEKYLNKQFLNSSNRIGNEVISLVSRSGEPFSLIVNESRDSVLVGADVSGGEIVPFNYGDFFTSFDPNQIFLRVGIV